MRFAQHEQRMWVCVGTPWLVVERAALPSVERIVDRSLALCR